MPAVAKNNATKKPKKELPHESMRGLLVFGVVLLAVVWALFTTMYHRWTIFDFVVDTHRAAFSGESTDAKKGGKTQPTANKNQQQPPTEQPKKFKAEHSSSRTKPIRDTNSAPPTAPPSQEDYKRQQQLERATWNEDDFPFKEHLLSDQCDLEIVDARELSREAFEQVYLEKKPVVLRHATDVSKFTAAVQRKPLLDRWGEYLVTLSTANKNSYNKKEEFFSVYVKDMMYPTTMDASGNGSWYHFGDNKHEEWKDLFDLYPKPHKYIYGPYASMSFGLGGSGSGVPFHTHGHVFAEVFYGRKRWFFQAPGPEPEFDPDATSLSWVSGIYKNMASSDKAKILDCTLGPGDLLYIPGLWHHATLNIGETVFMSTFV